MRWPMRLFLNFSKIPSPELSWRLILRYFRPTHVPLNRFVSGYSRPMMPSAGSPIWKPFIIPPTSVPLSMMPGGAPNAISEMTSKVRKTDQDAESNGFPFFANSPSTFAIHLPSAASINGFSFLTFVEQASNQFPMIGMFPPIFHGNHALPGRSGPGEVLLRLIRMSMIDFA